MLFFLEYLYEVVRSWGNSDIYFNIQNIIDMISLQCLTLKSEYTRLDKQSFAKPELAAYKVIETFYPTCLLCCNYRAFQIWCLKRFLMSAPKAPKAEGHGVGLAKAYLHLVSLQGLQCPGSARPCGHRVQKHDSPSASALELTMQSKTSFYMIRILINDVTRSAKIVQMFRGLQIWKDSVVDAARKGWETPGSCCNELETSRLVFGGIWKLKQAESWVQWAIGSKAILCTLNKWDSSSKSISTCSFEWLTPSRKALTSNHM